MSRLAAIPLPFLLLSFWLLIAAEAVAAAPQDAGLFVDPSNREESLNFYRSQYLMTSLPRVSWSGDLATCEPGTTSPEFRAKVFQRINYFRAMAGVPAVVEDQEYSSKAQAAALIISTSTLSHNPSPNSRCYSEDGAEAAGKSNLSGSRIGWSAVTGYIADYSHGAVGHRRWLLYPQAREMGTGDIPSGASSGVNALFVIDRVGGTRPVTREPYVAWPPPGYVPYPLVFARWSFSHPGANFSSASVSMSRNGIAIPVTLAQVVSGYGEPTLAWIPTEAALESAPASDVTYSVSVRDVFIGGSPRSFDYQVTVFDPGEEPSVDVPRDRTRQSSDEFDSRLRYRRRLHR